MQGYDYVGKVISERTKKKPIVYLKELINFIEVKITEKILTQDLSLLLPYDRFKAIRKKLIKETLMFLRDEIKRLNKFVNNL